VPNYQAQRVLARPQEVEAEVQPRAQRQRGLQVKEKLLRSYHIAHTSIKYTKNR